MPLFLLLFAADWWTPQRAVETAAPVSAPVVHRQSGALAGLVVYLSAGHGRRILTRAGDPHAFDYQRPAFEDVREDLWTARFVTYHLAPALERAGATVLTPRERDTNPVAVVVDDRDRTFAPLGPGTWERAPRATGEGAMVMRPGARATWTVRVPDTGNWHLYASWTEGSDRDPSAVYTVHHAGGADRFAVDQRSHGGQWWPIGTYDLAAGDWVRVELSGSGDGTLSADAIRLGGGAYTVTDPKTQEWVTTPAWMVSAIHHLPRIGLPDAITDGEHSDARLRARWATWAHPPGEEAVYLAIHSDGGRGTGTTAFAGIAKGAPVPAPTSLRLANLVRTGLVAGARTVDPDWIDRGTKTAPFSEISPATNPNLASALLEVGFHDNRNDRERLRDEAFLDATADGIVAGVIRYRNGEDAPSDPMKVAAALPDWQAALPPEAIQTVEWGPQAVEWAPVDSATGFRVRARVGDRWTAPEWLQDCTWICPPAASEVEVVPVNDAGLGRPTVTKR